MFKCDIPYRYSWLNVIKIFPAYVPAGLTEAPPACSLPPILICVLPGAAIVVMKGDTGEVSPIVQVSIPPLLPDKFSTALLMMEIMVPAGASMSKIAW